MQQKEHVIRILPNGTADFIYSDDLLFLSENQSKVTTKRVSNVEPSGRGWTADMTPLGHEMILGPFDTRQEALDAEVEYLKTEHFGLISQVRN